jgi:hypothetical protein
MTYLKSYITGSNDSILNEVRQTTTLSLVGVHQDTILGHLLKITLGNVSLRVWISMTSRDWRLRSHKRQWHFMTGEHLYG